MRNILSVPIIFILCVFYRPVFAVDILIDKNPVSFANIFVGPNQVVRNNAISVNKSIQYRITRTGWRSGTTPPNITVNLNVNDFITDVSRTFDVTGVFNMPISFDDVFFFEAIAVEFGDQPEPDEFNIVGEIKVVARVGCAEGDPLCNPKGAICTIDFNNESHIFVESSDYEKEISTALGKAVRKHNEGFNPYEMPLTFLFDVIGIADYMEPIEACCNCSSSCYQSMCSKDCLPAISYTKSKNSPLVSFFSWPWAQDEVFYSKAGLPLEIVVEIPSGMRGYSVIGGSYFENHYYNAASAPRMRITQLVETDSYPANTEIYDGPVLCTGTTRDYATLRHPEPTSNVPKINIYVSDEPIK